MKLSYYAYSVTHRPTAEHYQFDIRPFINAFCALTDVRFKSQFKYLDEQVFLLKQSPNLYLFLMTRTNEIIKKIRSSDLNVSEIYDLLQQDEKLGFASYVFIEPSFLGFASTVMAPRFQAFVGFLEDIFAAIGLNEYQFILHPLLHQASKADVMSMDYMGRTSVQINKESSFFEDMRNIFNGTTEDFADVGSIEITIKPMPRKNIDVAVRKVLRHVPDEGLDSFVIKAKQTIADQLVEVYLAGNGHLSDTIKKDSDQRINDQIREKINRNNVLLDKASEYITSGDFRSETPEAFLRFLPQDAWQEFIDS